MRIISSITKKVIRVKQPIKSAKPTETAKPIKFKIKTIKWTWPKDVQSKNVYRDDEFVQTNTREEAIKAIDFLMAQRKGLTYTITVLRDEKYFTYFRHSMPCLGGLVKYKASHGDRHFMNPYFPRDIRVMFPEGEIIFVACAGKANANTPYGKFILSEESPWVSAFGSRDAVIFNNNYFILTDMDTDPTVLYSFMRLGRVSYGVTAFPQWNPRAGILASNFSAADPRRLAGQKPLRISGGTWAEGFGYTRPYNESIFKTSLPNKLKDFAKVGSYPQAPQTINYFTKEMKDKFGVTISGIIDPKDKKIEGALVKAWDYFKEEAEKLEE